VFSGCAVEEDGDAVWKMRRCDRNWKLVNKEVDPGKLEVWADQLEERSLRPPWIEWHDERAGVLGTDVGSSVCDANGVLSVNGLNGVVISPVIGSRNWTLKFERVLLIKKLGKPFIKKNCTPFVFISLSSGKDNKKEWKWWVSKTWFSFIKQLAAGGTLILTVVDLLNMYSAARGSQ
jgi:hypothetical protein